MKCSKTPHTEVMLYRVSVLLPSADMNLDAIQLHLNESQIQEIISTTGNRHSQITFINDTNDYYLTAL